MTRVMDSGGSTRERQIRDYADSRVGSFGVLGAVCPVAAQIRAIRQFEGACSPLCVMMTFASARWAMVLALRIFSECAHQRFRCSVSQPLTTERL